MSTPESFLMGGAPSASFLSVGTTHSGTITDEPIIVQQRDPVDQKLKYWDNGDPMNQLVVTIATTERDPKVADDDGLRRIFIKANLRRAVSDAVRKSGAKNLAVGGVLSVTYTGDGPQENKALNAPKLFSATYAPPASGQETFLAETPAASAPPVSTPSVAPAQSAFTPEQLAAMKAAGMDTSRFTTV